MIQTLRETLNHSRGSNEYLLSGGKEAVLHFAMDEVLIALYCLITLLIREDVTQIL
jgi:hypothetical protein